MLVGSRSRAALLVLTLALPALPATAGEPPVTVAPPLPAAVRDAVEAPSAASGRVLVDALRRASAGRVGVAAAAGGPAQGPPEPVRLGDVGDLDGDGRRDVVEERRERSVVRSGRTGAVLLQRTGDVLVGATGAGAVRLLALGVDLREAPGGFAVDVRVAGLDRRGRAVWSLARQGSVRQVGVDEAGVAVLDRLPVVVAPHTDAAGRPVLLLGELSGSFSGPAATTRLDLATVGLADGASTRLPTVVGVGAGLPSVTPLGPELGRRGCHLAVQPAAAAALAQLQCGAGAPVWSRPVDLLDAGAALAGDFDGDRRPDVVLTTFGFEPPEPGEPGRGSRVLSGATGAALARGTVDGLIPLGVDVSGDRQPDFQRPLFEEGLGLQGVTLGGTQLYRRTVELRGSGGISLLLGLDVTGDAVPDGFLTGEPQDGPSTGVVVDGRNGRTVRVAGGTGLLLPGLRGRGGDVVVQDVEGGRSRITVHAGDTGRRLARVVVPGRPGPVSPGAVLAVDVDRDGRRDLVSATRTGTQRRTTATTRDGRLLWQQTATVPASRPDGAIVLG